MQHEFILNDDANIADIISTIEFSLTTLRDGSVVLMKTSEGEYIATYGPEDTESAESHFRSLLTPMQYAALVMDAQVTYDLQCEDEGNRQLSYYGG